MKAEDRQSHYYTDTTNTGSGNSQAELIMSIRRKTQWKIRSIHLQGGFAQDPVDLTIVIGVYVSDLNQTWPGFRDFEEFVDNCVCHDIQHWRVIADGASTIDTMIDTMFYYDENEEVFSRDAGDPFEATSLYLASRIGSNAIDWVATATIEYEEITIQDVWSDPSEWEDATFEEVAIYCV